MTIRRTRRVRSTSGRGPRKPPDERKDYLIQARVPRELDDMLKQDAKRRRLSVSHLIRNVLEDTYKLVDGVISDVDTIVQESVELTGRMRRDAREIARSAARVREAHVQEREAAAKAPRASDTDGARVPERQPAPATNGTSHAALPGAGDEPSFEERTADIYAWNPVVLNRPAHCERCAAALSRGETGHLGLSQNPASTPRWLCATCLAAL